jgi:phosphoribosyl-ATP pyrophosphohydrolase/phosphoribosyl-AMP cyclohydrolase
LNHKVSRFLLSLFAYLFLFSGLSVVAMMLDFTKMPDQLVPAIVQDATTGQVLMLGYFNDEAWQLTQTQGRVTFFSRSKQRLWTKGETSGNYLQVVSLHVDCDQDTVLVLAHPDGPTCHRGTTSCFEPALGEVAATEKPPAPAVGFLAELDRLIEQRRLHPELEPGSYTVRLFEKGLARIAQKVGEEAVETVIEAMTGNQAELTGEAADLLFHLMVLLRVSGSSLEQVLAVLRQRHQRISAGERRPLPE